MRFRLLLAVLSIVLLAPGAAAAAGVGDTTLVSGTGALGALPEQGVNDAARVSEFYEYDAVALNGDGRYSVFVSESDGLSPDDDDRYANVFRKDRVTGALVLISRSTAGAAANSYSYSPTISDDGNLVAFSSAATNLDPGDADMGHDVFVRNVSAGTTTLVSTGAQDCPAVGPDNQNPDCGRAMISGNGQYVAYATTATLGTSDTNGVLDVYRRKVDGSAPVLVSQAEGSLPLHAGNARSWDPTIDDTGGFVAFTSLATDLPSTPAATDTNNASDVFVRTMATSDIRLVSSVSGDQTKALGAGSNQGHISGDGLMVAFATVAKDADPTVADADLNEDAYLRTLSTFTNTLIGRANGLTGAKADGYNTVPLSISDDGQWTVLRSNALSLGGATDRSPNIYVRRLIPSITGVTLPLSGGPHGFSENAPKGAISDDGSLALVTSSTSLDATARMEREVYERTVTVPAGAAEVVSRPPGNGPYGATDMGLGDDRSGAMPRRMSADGRYAVFASMTVVPPAVVLGQYTSNVYRRDLLTGALELVSRASGPDGAAANDGSFGPSISADGQRVTFASYATNLGVSGGQGQVYVRDLTAQTTELISRADGPTGAPDDTAYDGEISSDGRRVAYLGTKGGIEHAMVRDLAAKTTVRVDRADGPDGALSTGNTNHVSINGDGTRVAFVTSSADVDPIDADNISDVYVRDLVAGTTRLVSRADGAGGAKTTMSVYGAEITADGERVVFSARDPALVPDGAGWPDNAYELVVRDLGAQTTRLVSAGPSGPANDDVGDFSLDRTGDRIAFVTRATNLVAGSGTVDSVFVRRGSTGQLLAMPAWQPAHSRSAYGASGPNVSADGRCLLFHAAGIGPIAGISPDFVNVFVRPLDGGTCPTPAAEKPPGDKPPGDKPPGDKPGQTPPTSTVPRLTKLTVTHARFRVGTAKTAVSAGAAATKAKKKAKKKAKVGTTFRFTLSAKATVAVTLEQKATGRRKGARCVKPTKKLAKKKRCTRYVKVGTLTRSGVKAGAVKLAFSGRLGKKALKPGSYRATAVAKAGAKASAPAKVTFAVVRK